MLPFRLLFNQSDLWITLISSSPRQQCPRALASSNPHGRIVGYGEIGPKGLLKRRQNLPQNAISLEVKRIRTRKSACGRWSVWAQWKERLRCCVGEPDYQYAGSLGPFP